MPILDAIYTFSVGIYYLKNNYMYLAEGKLYELSYNI